MLGPMPTRPGELWTCHLGVVEYREALALQEDLRERRQRDEIADTLLCLEHPPTYTLGRRTAEGELPMGKDFYRAQGIEVVEVDRGGGVTYHGPGQLVAYPIVRTDDVVGLVRAMERAMIAALADEGVEASAPEGLTGVWVGERKIGSIGLHVQRGVTTHGFAVNVENDLQPFEWVIACGGDGVRTTSLILETGRGAGALRCFRRRAAFRMAEATGRRQRLVGRARLGLPAPAPAARPPVAAGA